MRRRCIADIGDGRTSEFRGHTPARCRPIQDVRLLDHAREVGDRLFIDDRRLWLSSLPDFRQVAAGQDCQEARSHPPIKAVTGQRDMKSPTPLRLFLATNAFVLLLRRRLLLIHEFADRLIPLRPGLLPIVLVAS
jgi:hypothetical protein